VTTEADLGPESNKAAAVFDSVIHLAYNEGRGATIMKKQTTGFRTAAILLLGLGAAAATAAIEGQKVSNPRTSNGGWVEDAGKVLGPEYIALINAVSETLKIKTTAEFAVVTIDNLGGLAIEDFAARLFKQFGIGAAGKENGLLLLFSRDDRRVRLEAWKGRSPTPPRAAFSMSRRSPSFARAGTDAAFTPPPKRPPR
jgi:hypothetical protein